MALGVAVAVMCAIWGSTWLVVREGLAYVPPFGGAALRFYLAWLVLLVVAPRIAAREGGAPPTAALVWSMGVLNFALTYGLVYWAEQYLPSALAAVLWSVYSLFMAAVGHRFVPGEEVRPAAWFGVLLGFAGVACLFATDLADVDLAAYSGAPAGLGVAGVAALFLVAPLGAAFGTAHVKRSGAGTSSALLNRDGMFVGATLLAVVSLLFERDAVWRFELRGVLCLLYLAIAGTVVTFTLYFWALRYARANQLALMSYVTPAIAVLLGVGVAGEPVTRWTGLGLVTILLGVACSMWLGRPAPAARERVR